MKNHTKSFKTIKLGVFLGDFIIKSKNFNKIYIRFRTAITAIRNIS